LIVLSGLIIFLITKTDPKKLFAILLFSVPLIYAIGKLGCFLNGCCYGIDYNGPMRVIYSNSKHAPTGISLFPVQLTDSIVNLIIFIIATIIYHKKKDIRNTLPLIILACSIVKFLLDFLRTPGTYIISLNQIFCIIAFILGIIIFIKSKKAPTSS
jgi:phosphatidylglycerol:prolipoprotein diacylglycerol transferase